MDSRSCSLFSLCALILFGAAAGRAQGISNTSAPIAADFTAKPPATEKIDELSASRDRANRIVVPVMVNDRGPFNFLLDTGANQSVVGPALVKLLGLESAVPPTSKLRGVTGEAIVPSVKLRRLQAGSLRMENLRLAVVDATLDGVDGVLGVDGFRNKRLAVHITSNRVTIERSSDQPASWHYATFPVAFRHGQLVVVAASVGRTGTKAVIDTGSQGSLGNSRLRQALFPKAGTDQLLQTAQVKGVTGLTQSGERHLTSSIRFINAADPRYDAIQVDGITIAYGDFYVFKLWDLERQPAMLMGMDILSTMEEVIIDYGRKELQLRTRRDL